MNIIWSRYGKLIGLLSVSTGLLLIWAFVVPIYEAPDEPHHWRYAHYLHENRVLPLYTPELVEANSPPLYYLLAAPFAFDTVEPKAILNEQYQSPAPPRWFDDSSRDIGKHWPIRSARLISVVISTITVLFCFLLGKEATGSETTGLLTGGIVAFLPQFSFRGMNVSNDSLVTMLCAIVTYLTIRLVKRGFTWRLGIIAAVISALAFLSKTNAIFLPIPLSLAIITTQGTWKTRLWRLSVLGLALLIVSPWLVRNFILYGDPLASHIMLIVVTNIIDIKPITSPYFLTTFPKYLYMSFVGMFGWMNLPMSGWLYSFFGLLFGAAILGHIYRTLHHQVDRLVTFILLTFPILSLGITVYINLNFSQPQGRYLFPALGAIALLVGLGLEGLPFWSKRLTYLLLGVLMILNLFVVITIIIPAYWH